MIDKCQLWIYNLINQGDDQMAKTRRAPWDYERRQSPYNQVWTAERQREWDIRIDAQIKGGCLLEHTGGKCEKCAPFYPQEFQEQAFDACTCVLPEQSCPACRQTAARVYEEIIA
jgi:hypothetical protein